MRDQRLTFIVAAVFLCLLVMYLWGIWSVIMPQLWALRSAHRLLGDWGRAILGVAVVNWALIQALLFLADPRKKLSALEPEIVAIKQRYATDRERRDILLLELYRREGIAGWAAVGKPLMALVTIWLLLAMYAALWQLPELRGARLLWIPDLSQRDPLYLLPLGSVVLSVLSLLAKPPTAQTERGRGGGLLGTALFACVVFLFPASFVLFGSVSKVFTLLASLGRRAVA